MPILTSDVKWKSSLTVNDTPANGGRMVQTVIASGVKNNLFPDVPKAERDAGSVKYRKVFIDVGNIDNHALVDARVFVDVPTNGQDGVHILAATFSDTQSDINGTYKEYAAATVSESTTNDTTNIKVTLDVAGSQPFAIGDHVRITTRTAVDAAGFEGYFTLTAVSYTGADSATLTINNPVGAILPELGARVANLIMLSEVKAGHVNLVKTSASGHFDADFLTIYSLGAVHQTVSLTFTSETAYSVQGDVSGVIGNGTVGAAFEPLNPATSTEMMRIEPQAWSGTWAAGDSLTFEMRPAAIPLWYKRIVPAGATEVAGNNVVVGLIGESM
jgi:hypothetical protein